MSEQAKIVKLLKLITLLSGSFGYSVMQLANRLEISERTVYRYIDTFREAGFVINKDENARFKLEKNASENKDLSELLHFTEEESFILSKAIHSIDNDNLLKSNLVKKLYTLYDFDRVADSVVRKEQAENVHLLIKAIKDKKQVVLKNYRSAKSNTECDRIVEPFDFTQNYIALWCWEVESNTNKIFKTARIDKVEVLESGWKNEPLHHQNFIDAFRVSSKEKLRVKLLMNMRAYNLMIEEYPLTEKDISKNIDGNYIYDGNVCSYEGVGRFVLGLPGEIEVVETIDFKAFLRNKINKI